jgi:hypothetical protein
MAQPVKMRSLRKFTLRSLSGHCIQFEKDVSTIVPAHLVTEAMAKGAVPDDETVLEVNEGEVVEDPTGLDREVKIKEALIKIRARNGRDDFTAGGKPKAGVTKDETGFMVDQREIAKVYQMILDEEHGD